eukprot:c8379_g1_i1.p1 GENE.c8379_g1_i1~~c8379_g1_i1.p1  ORF type:complete len:311 (-),score=80.63 c8379_g1_i1:144-1076(-)
MLRSPDADHIKPSDFTPWLNELLEYHPALDFLKSTPEFQTAYVETVIARIFYRVNKQRNDRLSLAEVLLAPCLMEAMTEVDEETDINEVRTFFSYEHFYVIYCKFWELDQNRDRFLEKADLLRYNNYALTNTIVDRIFQVHCTRNQMSYEQFVYFILSEEDKNTPEALKYWFYVFDVDGDGVLSPSELELLYREQGNRLVSIPHERVEFRDLLCQMHDMIEPRVPSHFTLADLKRCRMGGNLFSVISNINKFLYFEQADPLIGYDDRLAQGITDWDRFADAEYGRLAVDDDEVDRLEPIGNLTNRFGELS